MTKLLHVAFIVRDTSLHQVLTAVEPFKPANLEVRAILANITSPRGPISRKKARGAAKAAVIQHLLTGKKISVVGFAQATGLGQKAISSQVHRMFKDKTVRRVTPGVYVATPKLKESLKNENL